MENNLNENVSVGSGKKITLPIKIIIIGCAIGLVVAGIGGIKQLNANKTNEERKQAATKASQDFMTTDAFPKFSMREVTLAGGTVRLTVMAKGAGMICPNMATMLCVALTDAKVARDPWQAMFGRAVEKTFNRVSVDGDTSTNDTILGLANGASGVAAESAADLALLEEALTDILGTVSHMLVMDGEGASKVIHITVTGAASDDDARTVARSVGHSQLVKTAIYGGDANWGRIVTAVGYSGAQFDPSKVSMKLCGIDELYCFFRQQMLIL